MCVCECVRGSGCGRGCVRLTPPHQDQQLLTLSQRLQLLLPLIQDAAADPHLLTSTFLLRQEDMAWNSWIGIAAVFLHWEYFATTIVPSESYQMPPSGVFLSYLVANKSSITPVMGGITEDTGDVLCNTLQEEGKSGAGFFCLWNGSDINSPDNRTLQETMRSALPPDIHLLDHTWHLLCWAGEYSSRITCEIRYVTQETHLKAELSPELYYTLDDRSGRRIAADCRPQRYNVRECSIPPVAHNDSCILWLEIPDTATSLPSPQISLNAADIRKPNSPSDLRMEITDEGKLQILWSHPPPLGHRLQYQVRYYLNTSENHSQFFQIVDEANILLNVTESCAPLVFQVRCRRLRPPGVWSNWSTPIVLKSQDGFYFPQKVLVGTGSSVSVFCMYCDNNRKVPSKAITWGLNLAQEIPPQRYAAVSEYIGKVTITNLLTTTPKGKFQYDALYCCVPSSGCQPRYAEIYVMDVNISITCETDGQVKVMTCRWSSKHIASYRDSTFTFRYYHDINYCFETDINDDAAMSKNCALQEDDFYKCVFNTIRATYSYYMWVEIQRPMGTLRSPPVCVRPVEVVKPYSPWLVRAEVTSGMEHLHVTWQPRFAAFDFMYQLRYRVHGQEAAWQVLDIHNNESAAIRDVDACEPYTVQIRCKALDVSGYWSDWSEPVHTEITDIRAPLKGPEFWRLLQKPLLQRGDNVTLVWQPAQREQLLCRVGGYEVLHQAPDAISWSQNIGNATNYTFTLQHSAVTVTVQAVNSRGHSRMNRNLTLSEKMSAVPAVKSLDVYPLNSSAVAVWTLLSAPYEPVEVVLEWRNLRENTPVRWAHIPPNVSKYYIEDHFFAIERYRFSLTPVFAGGIGSPRIVYEFSKVTDEMRNNAGLYVILPVITATSFLLVITLAISHQRMKQMFWKDIPNPKYCSWAQGINFQKPDTLENLFMKHRDHLAHSFPLISEPEAIFENLNTDKGWGKDNTDDLSIVDHLTDDHDSACTTSHFSSSCTYREEAEGSMYQGSSSPSSVQYATILTNPQPSKQGISGRKMSVSSCDGCFLRNSSIVIGNLEDEKQAFLIMAGLQAKQPSKMSSNSIVSSEGFSEPSDQEESLEGDILERNVYYMGLESIQDNPQDGYFSENPLVTYHIQERISYQDMDFRKDKSSRFLDNNYVHRSLVKKSLRSYLPQFQIQSTSETEMFDICP